ncbi:hypothetical protein B296_00027072 [Ensete ventricosum]|uniref:DUF569 domain-containing protein n=1 Tax=Ensete ventricosum TaxID=4639 RepID=A0A426XLR5_ENSVE|nr:hypothetical protein B296_00027072 [Ensete ventricosum]
MKRVSQHRRDAWLGGRWTVDIITNHLNTPALRFRSWCGHYLAVDRKVLHHIPHGFSDHERWKPLQEGSRVLLRCNLVDYLRAHDSHLPWEPSVTVGTPSWRQYRNWYQWHVEVLETQEQPPIPPPFQPVEATFGTAIAPHPRKPDCLPPQERNHPTVPMFLPVFPTALVLPPHPWLSSPPHRPMRPLRRPEELLPPRPWYRSPPC